MRDVCPFAASQLIRIAGSSTSASRSIEPTTVLHVAHVHHARTPARTRARPSIRHTTLTVPRAPRWRRKLPASRHAGDLAAPVDSLLLAS